MTKKQELIKLAKQLKLKVRPKMTCMQIQEMIDAKLPAIPWNVKEEKPKEFRIYTTISAMLIAAKSLYEARGIAVKDGYKLVCQDSPDGNHEFTPDIEYDHSGKTLNCEHCGKLKEGKKSSDPIPAQLQALPHSTSAVHTSALSTANGTVATSKSPVASKLAHAAAMQDNSPHVVISALAGTGKSTTILLGVVDLCGGDPTFLPAAMAGKDIHITPSAKQLAIWDAIRMSAGKVKSVRMVAFNKSIATHLNDSIKALKLPDWVSASTMHGMGFAAVNKTFKLKQPGAVNSHRVSNIIEELTGTDIWELRKNDPILLKATEELVGLCKMNLVGCSPEDPHPHDCVWADDLAELASYYDIDLNGSEERVFELVPRVLERCKDVARDGCVDFDDMIFIPVALNLPMPQYDVLFDDEFQDANRCQQSLAKRAGKRLVLIGDEHQAIYGFAGADSQSMARMQKELSATPRGCMHLTLTETRRCGKAIVREAQKYVPDFEAHSSNPDGKVSYASFKGPDTQPDVVGGVCQKCKAQVVDHGGDTVGCSCGFSRISYRAQVRDGDFILCRTNAPLVSECFKFLKTGRKAVIAGRDVGQGLISTITKLKSSSVEGLARRLDEWHHKESKKEQAKRNPCENKLAALQDRYDCLMCFMEGMGTVDAVVRKIESIFTDNKDAPGIRLSSIHKSKGLEADRVFILQVGGGPRYDKMQAWERQQSTNLEYVAVTRAIHELIYVS